MAKQVIKQSYSSNTLPDMYIRSEDNKEQKMYKVEGTLPIKETGTFDVTNYAKVRVEVPELNNNTPEQPTKILTMHDMEPLVFKDGEPIPDVFYVYKSQLFYGEVNPRIEQNKVINTVEETHEHNYVSRETDRYIIYECSCGDSYSEPKFQPPTEETIQKHVKELHMSDGNNKNIYISFANTATVDLQIKSNNVRYSDMWVFTQVSDITSRVIESRYYNMGFIIQYQEDIFTDDKQEMTMHNSHWRLNPPVDLNITDEYLMDKNNYIETSPFNDSPNTDIRTRPYLFALPYATYNIEYDYMKSIRDMNNPMDEQFESSQEEKDNMFKITDVGTFLKVEIKDKELCKQLTKLELNTPSIKFDSLTIPEIFKLK